MGVMVVQREGMDGCLGGHTEVLAQRWSVYVVYKNNKRLNAAQFCAHETVLQVFECSPINVEARRVGSGRVVHG